MNFSTCIDNDGMKSSKRRFTFLSLIILVKFFPKSILISVKLIMILKLSCSMISNVVLVGLIAD